MLDATWGTLILSSFMTNVGQDCASKINPNVVYVKELSLTMFCEKVKPVHFKIN